MPAPLRGFLLGEPRCAETLHSSENISGRPASLRARSASGGRGFTTVSGSWASPGRPPATLAGDRRALAERSPGPAGAPPALADLPRSVADRPRAPAERPPG